MFNFTRIIARILAFHLKHIGGTFGGRFQNRIGINTFIQLVNSTIRLTPSPEIISITRKRERYRLRFRLFLPLTPKIKSR